MSFSSNSIAPGAMPGLTPPHRLAASRPQTTVAVRKAASRACANQADVRAAAPAQNRQSALPRSNPLDPDPAAALVQDPESAFSRINPLNPEPAPPVQTPKSAFPRINPLNPEPAPPVQIPKSAFSRINPMNPEPASPMQTPKSAFPRIDPVNPEPAAPVQTPKSASSRINPLNPEPAAPPVQTPKSASSRINPLNPEPATLPAQNPEFAFPRMNPLNPEPAAPPAPNSVSAFSRINPMDPKPPAARAQNPKMRVFPNRPSDPAPVQHALRHLRDGDIRPGPQLPPIALAAGVFVLAATQHPSHDRAMADAQPDRAAALARQLLGLTARFGARADENPFGNPVLLVSLAITRRMDTGELSEDAIAGLIRYLRDAAFADRARRLADYVGGVDHAENDAALARLAQHLLRPDPERQPGTLGRVPRAGGADPRFAAVFTAHPTFSLAVRRRPCPGRAPHAAGAHPASTRTARRRSRCRTEFAQSVAAIANGRDAIDRFNAALIVGRPHRLAGPLDRADAAAGHSVQLGRLRHRRPHRYRLVGHAAAAAGNETAAACAAARPAGGAAAAGATRGARRRRARGGARRSSPPAPTRPIRRASPPSHTR